MAERRASGPGSGGAGTLTKGAGPVPGTDRLKEELESYVEARLQLLLEGVGQRMGEGARRLAEGHLAPHGLGSAVAKGGKKLREHMPSGTEALTSTASHAKDKVLDKAKDVTTGHLPGKKDKAQDKAPDAAGKGLTIIEDIDVGVPVREAYDQWTQFQEFERFTKGVVAVEQQDDTTTKWQVKVAKANRRWRGTITEQVPDERIAWTSEGEKATTKGVVTFHPLGENLTKVLLVLRYFPKGPFERIGGLVRAQGRRARLDLKLYRTFVMMRGEATGGWRGEIREGEVVQGHEEAEEAEQAEAAEKEREDRAEDRAEDEDEDTAPEDRYEGEEPDEDDEYGSGEEDWQEDEEDEDEEDDEDDEDREPADRDEDDEESGDRDKDAEDTEATDEYDDHEDADDTDDTEEASRPTR